MEQSKKKPKRTPQSALAKKGHPIPVLPKMKFCGPEHKHFEKKIKIKVPPTPSSSTGTRPDEQFHVILGSDKLLRLPNNVELSFGQMIALGGDFYGIPEHPIINPSEEKDKQESGRKDRFTNAYNTLAHAPQEDVQKELDQILKVLKKEESEIEALACMNGHLCMVPSEYYEKFEISFSKEWDRILGGKWFFGVPVISGRMMKLAENNHDHFLPHAKDAYLTGHKLALEKAQEAGKREPHEEKTSLLDEAYSIDAFACHFLTDSFASGHMRTPRIELGKEITPAKAGHLLAKYMHDEDNKYGLRVTNAKGDKWIAYGDGKLLNDESKDNLEMAVKAVQTSVDQVYEAFLHPENFQDSSRVTDFLPVLDGKEKNNCPMFQVKDDKLLRRSNLNDLSDAKTVSVGRWAALKALFKILSYKPKNSAIQSLNPAKRRRVAKK